ncbi:serine/threonine-protein kinase [Chitinilyticum litopenaei]|uniref:serine/threonine-protein kinase n=1 Tax=Chitinilyticum litopenaei TaxID=1121276 RepID=UPI001FE11718|nr:serine/threonine-protein kinase [Chitinilyticum litopenaei]
MAIAGNPGVVVRATGLMAVLLAASAGSAAVPQAPWALSASLAALVLLLPALLLCYARARPAMAGLLEMLILLLLPALAAVLWWLEDVLWLPVLPLCAVLAGNWLRRRLPASVQAGGVPADAELARLLATPPDAAAQAQLLALARSFEARGLRSKADAAYRFLQQHAPDLPGLPIAGAAPAAQPAPVVAVAPTATGMPATLGRYRLEKVLGRGAMGSVYLGVDPALGRQLAIKTMALAEEFDGEMLADARERFFREAETAGRLSHPNIVTLYDAGEADGLAYIAMELLAGAPLEANARPDNLLPLEEVLAIVRQVALALEYAHKHQVVHRDVKPGNVLYDPVTRKVKVTDFGIARLTDASRTRTGMVLGTPSFMSPEQLAGQHIDGRSDLYSLGVMLYQLSSGALPFGGDSLADLLYAIANLLPTDPRQYRPELPKALVAIIMKALQKDARQRFQSGAQFALALARLEAQLKGNTNAESRPGA